MLNDRNEPQRRERAARSRLMRCAGAMLAHASRVRRDERGVAAVEFAFLAPILIILFVGTIEISAAVSTDRKLSRLSSTLSDLVTQSQTLTDSDINNIMDASVKVMYPYTAQVTMTLTGIAISGGSAKVEWSRARNATALAKGQTYTVPAKIKKDGTFLVAAKVTTSYQPSFGWPTYTPPVSIGFTRTAIPMEEEIFLRPRIGSTVTIN